MKQVSSSRCVIAALVLVFGAVSYGYGQTPSSTPDPFVTQLTSTPAGGIGNPFLSPATDVSFNGRFVVFESNGNVATDNPDNADGNREIFLADYAQRKIFQLTNTRNVPKAAASPTPTPSPAASPTPTPAPTPADPTLVAIEVSNNRPMISFAPTPIVGGPNAGKVIYTIVFSSNAINPTDPNTNPTTTDANQEIWILELAPAANLTEAQLSSGAEFSEDLFTGSTFRQLTNTTASRAPTAGAAGLAPFVADDNREATISDNGDIIAFVSTRSFAGAGAGNADGNPELMMASRTGAAWSTFNLVQATNTQDQTVGSRIFSRFQQNPSLSASGGTVAFLSTANLVGNNNDDGAGHGNEEVYLADFSGTTVSNIRQVTRTKTDATFTFVNTLSFGRRLSRDGNMIAFTSKAADPKANSTTVRLFPAIFIYVASSDTFVQVGLPGTAGDVLQFPTFTDYNGTLTPTSIVFASALNFRTDGTFPAAGQESTGLNPQNQPQIFASTIPVTGNSFARLTRNPVGGFAGIRPLTTDTRKRLAFSLAGSELGGGNSDGSMEVFYLLSPPVVSESAAQLNFFAGASNFPVNPAPAASPSPSPTPTPTPGSVAFGLAPGELSIVRSADPADPLAPADAAAIGSGNENTRKPILPIELNGVSVSVNGAAAGLWFVGNTSAEGIVFVVPIGIQPGFATVVVNNNGRVFRNTLNIVVAQPDLFSSTGDAGGTITACNVTNPSVSGCVPGPFPLTSSNGTAAVATIIEIHLTGVRGVTTAETQVSIGGTNISPSSVRSNTNNFGFDLITITLPSTLAPGTYPVVVTVTRGTSTTTSRGTATAPTITITP
ncbi:MAG TPA: hypothetical protein VIT88_09385 [Pyrinomonadaceae bacterium]